MNKYKEPTQDKYEIHKKINRFKYALYKLNTLLEDRSEYKDFSGEIINDKIRHVESIIDRLEKEINE